MEVMVLSGRPTVRIIHPCGSLKGHEAALEEGMVLLERAGCTVRWNETLGKSEWRGIFAAPDDARYTEFLDALTEPEVDVVWCARGGSGGNRIVDRLVQSCRDLAPRPVVGFSDVSAFLNPLWDYLGWTTFHGPVVTSLGRAHPITDLDAVLTVLQSESGRIKFDAQDGPVLNGVLRGGNLTVLAASVGTPYGPRPRADSIWFFEDVGEAPYRLLRSLWQLKAAGCFEKASGVWLGDFDLSRDESDDFARSIRDDLGLPVIGGAPAGHSGKLACLPLGSKVRIDPGAGTCDYAVRRHRHG